jgi:hypothetical protein
MNYTSLRSLADIAVFSGFADLHPRLCGHKWVLPATVSGTILSQTKMVDELVAFQQRPHMPILGFGLGAHIIAAHRGYKILPYVEGHYGAMGESSHDVDYALGNTGKVNSHHRQMIDFYGSSPDVKKHTHIVAHCSKEATAICINDYNGHPSTYTATYTGKSPIPEAIISTGSGKQAALLTEFHPHMPGCGPEVKKMINNFLTSYYNIIL